MYTCSVTCLYIVRTKIVHWMTTSTASNRLFMLCAICSNCNYTVCSLYLLSFVWNAKSECCHLCRKIISKFNQTTWHHHVMKSNAKYAFLARSNPLFTAAEKFSFRLITLGWSSLLNENSWVQLFWETFSKNGPFCVTRFSIRLTGLCAGVSTHLRVGPLGLDLLSHLLCAAQQVITLPALQVEQTNTQ